MAFTSFMSSPTEVEKLMILPPPEVLEDNGRFIYGDPRDTAGQISNEIIDVSYPEEGGILVHRKGDLHPSKGLPFKEAVLAADVAKRAALNLIRFATSTPVRYFLPLGILIPPFIRRRIIRAALSAYADLVHTIADRASAYLVPNRYCTIAREVYRVGMELAGDDPAGQGIVRTICLVLEYDDAYRYRVQDLMGEVNVGEFLEYPVTEAKRILQIAAERGEGTAHKFQMLSKALPFLFLVKEIRAPVLEFFRRANIDALKLDEADWYKCLIWGGYRFKGVPDQERVSLRMMIDATWQLSNKST